MAVFVGHVNCRVVIDSFAKCILRITHVWLWCSFNFRSIIRICEKIKVARIKYASRIRRFTGIVKYVPIQVLKKLRATCEVMLQHAFTICCYQFVAIWRVGFADFIEICSKGFEKKKKTKLEIAYTILLHIIISCL